MNKLGILPTEIIRFLLLFAALSFSGYSLAETQPSPQVQTEKTKQYSQTGERGTDKFPLTVKIAPAPDADVNAAKEEKHRQEKAEEDRKLTYATITLAAITFFLALFTAALWYATRKLVIDAKDTSKRQLRAYVALEDIFFEGNVPKIRIKNHGQTPAHQMTIWTNATDSEPVATFQYQYPSDDATVNEQMLHPQQIYTARASTGIPYTIATAGFFLYGRLIYRDIYDHWWVTRFCHLHDGEGIFMPHCQHNREDGSYSSEQKALES